MLKYFTTINAVNLLICLILAAATLVPYLQVKDHGFITWDDEEYITDNTPVNQGLSWAGVKWALTTMHSSNWHPLTWLSHMVDCQLYGLNPGGHHLTNLFFHLANTLLLFLFFSKFSGALWPSALMAGLFALHPMHVESVSWVSERKDVLSTFFWLTAMWAYAYYVALPNRQRYLVVVLCLVLGLMAKPMVVTLPFILLLLDYWPLNRFPSWPFGAANPLPDRQPWWQYYWQIAWPLIREKIPLLGLAVLAAVLTLYVQNRSGSIVPLTMQPISDRIGNALVAYGKYILKVFWPYPMSYFYRLLPVPWWQVLAATLVLLALTGWLLYKARRYRYCTLGWLWYLVTLLPVIGLVQVGGQAMADRYSYVPYIGLFIILAWGLFDLSAGWRYPIVGFASASIVMLGIGIVATQRQAGIWRNSESLFLHAIKIDPLNYMAYNNMGLAYLKEGKLDRAIYYFQQSIAVNPPFASAYNNLGLALSRQGRVDEAVNCFNQAIKLAPAITPIYLNLAMSYRQQGKHREAAAALEQANRVGGK